MTQDGAAATPVAERSAKPKARFNLNRAQVVDENFLALISEIQSVPRSQANGVGGTEVLDRVIDPQSGLTGRDLIEMFESQIVTRHQDLESRAMRARSEGFYTIGSSGHEGNAVVGRLTRHTDMAFVHYRSGAFMAERARQVEDEDFTRDVMLSFAASSKDPIAGGRHRVWGSVKLWVPPQTSTIASQLPKVVGTALMLQRSKRLGVDFPLPEDAIVVSIIGDATVNHATAQTAFNAAGWATHQHIPVPVLFVCEDNGIGISVPTPKGWIEASFKNRPGIHYFKGNGLDLIEAYRVTRQAVAFCREHRVPVFLHLEVVRLLGHAGSDPETEYHGLDVIEAAEARDPLLASARLVVEQGLMSADEVSDLYESTRTKVREAAAAAVKTSKLSTAQEVMSPLAPYHPDAIAQEAARLPDPSERIKLFGAEDKLPEKGQPRHMAVNINMVLHDLLVKYPNAILFGEDVAKKGGVYHVTNDLFAKFGAARVFNTLLDETTILGLAIGAAHVGLLPIPEIQYLAYYHNAEDQIRGEACSLQFFSNNQYRNPMVIRIAGWGYQKGFGGHFHNDNSIAALRDVPGLIIATPSRGDDAVKMMRTCMAMAHVDGRVVAFIEPIALYMTKDLHEAKDGLWSFPYPPPGEFIPLGEGAVYSDKEGNGAARQQGKREGEAPAEPPRPNQGTTSEDLTIITFANGLHMSLRAQKILREKHNIRARVVDLRWLNPLNEEFIVEQALATGTVLVVDESRRTGGIGEAILAIIYERIGGQVRAARLNAYDTYIPLGPAADCVIPQAADVVRESINFLKAAGGTQTIPVPRTCPPKV
jgi:2-oxoisovalerate dehydrogenase E1 component